MKTVQVHLKTIVWMSLTIEVPEDENPKEFIDELIAHDPACRNSAIEDVQYLMETEEALEAEYYLPDEDYDDEYNLYGTAKFPTQEANNLMVLLDKEEDNPMRALYGLQQQETKDGNIPADDIVKMNQTLKGKLTVNEVLEIIRQL